MPKLILKIALDVPLDRLFDYLSGGQVVKIGQRVLVPFGRRSQIGIVMDMADTSDFPIEKLKPITQVFTDELPVDAETLNLVKFSASYYQYPLGQALLSALPARLRQIAPAVSRKHYAYQLTDFGQMQTVEQIPKRQLVTRRVFAALRAESLLTEADLDAISSSARKAVKQLVSDGWAISKQVQVSIKLPEMPAAVMPELNEEQAMAVKQIVNDSQSFKAWLLHGITGSGKTEVYIRLMQHVLENKCAQVLVLVPEINLTPQLEARFRSRLSNYPLVSLHSNLSESERLRNWQLAQSGTARIVIGTRLSIFTPLPNLKLIIIDEEHDSSYKQQDSMRYHARDVALVRAKRFNIPVVLGSATPALESWHNAAANKYHLLSLNQRAVTAAQLPNIECIDTTKVNLQHGLTPQLIAALRLRLKRKEQSLLFINRRGYSPVLLCSACHWIAPCMRCSSRLVVHLGLRALRCHHCGHEQKIPNQCPSCGNADLHPTGHGTQRLEQTLAQLLPTARIARVDRDSTSRKDALVEILDKVHNQEIDILVGTQMLAKGHDFPNLTLVGVIDTDSALHSPDFRASERLFAQLMQVAGRAGRADKAGQVIIQTQFPEHSLFNALRSQDYVSYANAMLQEREQVQFPPHVFMALLRAEANEYQLVQQFLNHAFTLARELTNDVTVYDPIRPQMERLKGMERGHVLMQSTSRQALQNVLKNLVGQLRGQPIASKVRWAVDVDPLEF
ncbi:MAG: primosomal protein N' [Methylotenera sp.]|uniref:primosomal protein N' n=1 Tax=Methylotenera sp. TaxID=2051956 RepID=UPI002730D4BA|nr:primosomal protein N' [Methylotenera sp.]MDP1522393.1 primosomal protein N' [Methylotenera sp.]MDP3308631.1 primosomal protein N' [Methylotenera sp.]MDP3819029.1 primosomal protein N' [Methylotenera sp.]MDZ4210370.1 primosomal protein N' [Methylotenera sp.]